MYRSFLVEGVTFNRDPITSVAECARRSRFTRVALPPRTRSAATRSQPSPISSAAGALPNRCDRRSFNGHHLL